MYNNLSIVIPTHERHEVLLRAINYYSSFNIDVYIADSSSSRLNIKLNKNIKDHLLDENIKDPFYLDKNETNLDLIRA